MIQEGEFYVTNSDVYRDLFFDDFVLMLDCRFVDRNGRFIIGFKDEYVNIEVSVYPNQVEVFNAWMTSGHIFATSDFHATAGPVHLLLILRAKALALYVDEQPLYYGSLVMPAQGEIYIRTIPARDEWTSEFTAAFDNLKIWEISGISIP